MSKVISDNSQGESVRFEAILEQAEGKKATGIAVPDEMVEKLGAGKRPAVRAVVNGHEYRTTLGTMGGRQMLPVSAAIREEAGLTAGQKINVVLTADSSPREVNVPDDFASALSGRAGTREFFDGLSNSLRRYHVDLINSSKTDETRVRRIDKAIELFAEGKPR
jgi:hypothetical protein